jgi:hypothetical protein
MGKAIGEILAYVLGAAISVAKAATRALHPRRAMRVGLSCGASPTAP